MNRTKSPLPNFDLAVAKRRRDLINEARRKRLRMSPRPKLQSYAEGIDNFEDQLMGVLEDENRGAT